MIYIYISFPRVIIKSQNILSKPTSVRWHIRLCMPLSLAKPYFFLLSGSLIRIPQRSARSTIYASRPAHADGWAVQCSFTCFLKNLVTTTPDPSAEIFLFYAWFEIIKSSPPIYDQWRVPRGFPSSPKHSVKRLSLSRALREGALSKTHHKTNTMHVGCSMDTQRSLLSRLAMFS